MSLSTVSIWARQSSRSLRVNRFQSVGASFASFCDFSSNPNDPYNPVPIYSKCSTFTKPTLPVEVSGDGPKLAMVSIDHLQSLVAREASIAFSSLLLPSMNMLDGRDEEGVCVRAEKLFHHKVEELPARK